MFLCFQSVTGPKTRVSVFKQNTLHTCFVKTQVFKFKTLVFCQNTYTCFQRVKRKCFLTCLDSKHPHLQCSLFVGNWEIKPSNKTKEEIVEGFSLRLIAPSRACEQS